MDADFGQQSQAFTLLHDKNMLAPASAASWCPTMDLLALATSDGQPALSRLDWNKTGGERENRLWTANPDSPVTSLGWRPDGKILVSRRRRGPAVPRRGRGGAARVDAPSRIRGHVAALAGRARGGLQTIGVRVSERDVAVRAAHQRRRRRRPRPPEARRRQGGRGCRRGCRRLDASAGRGREGSVRPLRPPTRLTVLCSGDARGDVVMNAFGIFPIASARVGDCPADFPIALAQMAAAQLRHAVLHASLAPDLSRILVAFRANGGVDAVGASAATPLLARRSVEMCTAASHGSQIAALAAELSERRAAAATWREAREDFDARIDALRERVGEDAAAWGVDVDERGRTRTNNARTIPWTWTIRWETTRWTRRRAKTQTRSE